LYEKLLSDPSYAVIKAAALALGETRSPGAYDALVKLLDIPSWRENIRASGLIGLAALEDKRALEVGFRYAQKGNPRAVRAAAIRLLGKIGADDPRTFTLIAETATRAFQDSDYEVATAAGESLVSLGDSRGLAVLEQIDREPLLAPRLKEQLVRYQQLLRKAIAAAPASGAKQP
jgi:HEAT repeat protein